MAKSKINKKNQVFLFTEKYYLIFIIIVVLILVFLVYGKQGIITLNSHITPSPKILIPSFTPTPTLIPTIQPTATSNSQTKNNQTGVTQTGKYTFEGNLPCDGRMGTSSEVFAALNNYRSVHGAGQLGWNDKLASVGQMRAQQITANGGRSDGHAGFIAFTNDQSNYQKVGFNELSENVGGTGNCPLLGVHVIEWLFARDAPHNNAQLDRWDAVGVGIDQNNVSIIFGRSPL